MVWALDLDADNAQFQLAAQYITMLDYISSVDMCQNISTVGYDYDCTAIDVGMRWWTGENSGPGLQGTCGRSAQLINGYYPVCDPEDAGYSCCGPYGYCGAGPEYCDCPMCVNYGADPKKLLEEPIQPTRSIQVWYGRRAELRSELAGNEARPVLNRRAEQGLAPAQNGKLPFRAWLCAVLTAPQNVELSAYF